MSPCRVVRLTSPGLFLGGYYRESLVSSMEVLCQNNASSGANTSRVIYLDRSIPRRVWSSPFVLLRRCTRRRKKRNTVHCCARFRAMVHNERCHVRHSLRLTFTFRAFLSCGWMPTYEIVTYSSLLYRMCYRGRVSQLFDKYKK